MQNFIRHSGKLPSLMLGLVLGFTPEIHAQILTPAAPFTTSKSDAELLATFKKMSLEELMNQKVITVAKQPGPYGSTPAAIQVVTILPPLKHLPVLTVSDCNDLIWNGGMIQFCNNPANSIRLKINAEGAKASGLSVSAKLLRIAEIVRPEED